MNSSKILRIVWDYALLTIGMVIFCCSWSFLLIPAGVVGGGVTGLCSVIFYGAHIPVAYSYLVINGILLLLAFVILGKGFGFKTIYVIVGTSILFRFLPNLDFLVMHLDEKMFTCLVGGFVEAVGIGMVLARGGSSGGSDIVAMIINKYWSISPGTIFLVTDIIIVASVLLVPGKGFSDLMYGYLTAVAFAVAVDWVMMGSKVSVQILIFSDEYEKIADTLIHNMDRGVTVIKAQGWYSKQDRNVLLVICRKKQHSEITKMVKIVDPRAFVSISAIKSVYGEGFEAVKTGIRLRRNKKKSDGS